MIRSLKSVGPKLVPFFKTVAIYFVVFIPYDQPSLLSTVLKCLPILSLMLFVLLNGMNLGDEYKYSRRILIGLIFCCLGDACLIWPNCFEPGMVMFAIGHAMYIAAFGFKPLNVPAGIIAYLASFFVILYLLPGLQGILLVGVPIYTLILVTMLWRGSAKIFSFADLLTPSNLCTLFGGLFFAVSDLIIGYDKFILKEDHGHQAAIMATYYAAQLSIALSVVEAVPQPGRSRTD